MLNKVYRIVDLGITMDCKASFTEHIDSLISKCNKFLGFLKRNTADIKDLSTNKILYFSFIRSKLEYCNFIWSPLYKVHIKRLEKIQNKFSKNLFYKMNWSNPILGHNDRNKFLDICSLAQRRIASSALCCFDILNGNINSPEILSKIKFNVPQRQLRSSETLHLDFHRTNYGLQEPFHQMATNFNRFTNDFDFHTSREASRTKIYKRLKTDPLNV